MIIGDINSMFQLDAIKEGLSDLCPGRFLTLHGMPGSGKSVLAAESVRDPKVTLNNFPGELTGLCLQNNN